MKQFNIFFIFVLLAFFNQHKIYSQNIDIAIICDVSKSLRSHELIQGKEAIQKLLTNGTIAQGWELSSTSSLNTFSFLFQHNSPICQGRDLVLLKFGTILSEQFPYFNEPTSIKIQTLQQAINFLEEAFPKQVTDQWTFEFLAEAVISKIMKEKYKSKEWLLFVLSDFIESHGFSLTEEQTNLVDDYLAGENIKFSTPVILRWNQRPDLQIKIVKLSITGHSMAKDKFTLLTPQNDYKFKNVKSINFIWNWKGDADDVINYKLFVRKKDRNKYNLFLQQRLKLNKFFYKTPPSGDYEWFVIANTKEGTFRSPIRRFQVKGASALPWILLLFILLGGAIATMKFVIPKIQSIQKRRKKDEF